MHAVSFFNRTFARLTLPSICVMVSLWLSTVADISSAIFFRSPTTPDSSESISSFWRIALSTSWRRSDAGICWDNGVAAAGRKDEELLLRVGFSSFFACAFSCAVRWLSISFVDGFAGFSAARSSYFWLVHLQKLLLNFSMIECIAASQYRRTDLPRFPTKIQFLGVLALMQRDYHESHRCVHWCGRAALLAALTRWLCLSQPTEHYIQA